MRWLVLAFALFALPSAAQEVPQWFTLSFLNIPEEVAEAARERKRLMLYFHQDGCPYCQKLVSVNFRDPKIVAKMRRDFSSVEINIFGDREVTWTDGRKMTEKQLAALIKVRYTPTLVFFDEKGALAARIDGYLPPDRFSAALDAAKAARARVDLTN
jgi:thioredoxin-related protein